MVLSKQFLCSVMTLVLAASLGAGGCAEADGALDTQDSQDSGDFTPDTGRPAPDGDAQDSPDSDETTFPAPVATIEATPTAGIAPLQVSFSTQVSAGSGAYEFAWDFGDSETSDAKSPSHLYQTPGTYQASLVVTDTTNSKTSDTVTVSIRVTDFESPLVSASASPSRGAAPLNVSFNTTTTGGSTPYSYEWDFGDASATSTAQTPSHEYTDPGTYTATVTVSDANGTTSSDQIDIEVETVDIFRVDLTANPATGVAPLGVSFATQIQGGVAPYTYAWDFDDGTNSTSSAPSHTFNGVGSYDVQLSITDDTGSVAEASVTVDALAPDALIVSPTASPDHGIAPQEVQFQSNAAGGSAPLTYQWTFGDGDTSDAKNPRKTFLSAGNYDVSLTVTDALGSTANDSITIEIGSDEVPTAGASASPQDGTAPLTTEFFGSADGGDAPLSYKWTFGDGSASTTSRNTNHTYATSGTYTATFLVTDADGDTDSATVLIKVREKEAPTVQASASPTSGTASLTVAFNAVAVSGTPPYAYNWTFDDGSPSSTSTNPSHTYTDAGTYNAQVTITDDDGDTASDTVTISVSNDSNPAVSATVDQNTGIAPHTVQLSANATGGDAPLSYEWIFDDSTANASGASVSHTYTDTGSFQPMVIVTDADGDTASATVDVQVRENAPDLAVDSFTITPSGRDITYDLVITNYGTVDSTAPFYITFYHDRASAPDYNSAIDGVGIYDGGDPTIAAGETISASITFESLPPGEQSGYVWIDYLEDVTDLDRSNNIAGPVDYSVDVVFINEFMYDTDGGDEKTFIELRATPGKDISGYTLVEVNGSNGSEESYEFPQGTLVPADGYLVLGDGLGDNEDLVDADFADLQNGPDNLVLKGPSDVELDAVGYGDFDSTETFVGYGDPAYPVKGNGYSLGRDGSLVTGNNRTDFVSWRVPTPGEPNEIALTNNADTCGDAYLVTDSSNSGLYTIQGDLADGATNSFTALSAPGVCEATGDSFGGSDQVYKLSVTSSTTALISFSDQSAHDLDLIVTASPCTSLDTGLEACLAGEEPDGAAEGIYSLAPGDYYLIVLEDATTPSGATSLPYSISVELEY